MYKYIYFIRLTVQENYINKGFSSVESRKKILKIKLQGPFRPADLEL